MPKSQGPSRGSAASQRLSQSTQELPNTPRTDGESRELARKAVRFFLMNDFDKAPIKHADIVKNVTRNTNQQTSRIIQIAGNMLKEVYGITLVSDETKKHYLLINNLSRRDGSKIFQEHISLPDEVQEDLTLLAIVLSLIFMVSNGRLDTGVDQEKVHSFLKLLKIDATSNDPHDYFGNVRKKFETYRSQRYLDVSRIDNTEPPKYEYRWGTRARDELSPRAALEFANEMYGRDNIQSWKAQFKAVEEYEGLNRQ